MMTYPNVVVPGNRTIAVLPAADQPLLRTRVKSSRSKPGSPASRLPAPAGRNRRGPAFVACKCRKPSCASSTMRTLPPDVMEMPPGSGIFSIRSTSAPHRAPRWRQPRRRTHSPPRRRRRISAKPRPRSQLDGALASAKRKSRTSLIPNDPGILPSFCCNAIAARSPFMSIHNRNADRQIRD